MKYKALFLLLLLAGCRQTDRSTIITSMQTIDRNGFSETVSTKDRLNVYQNLDFLTAQPFQKVLRVYGKDHEGKSHSKLTSYHPSGGVWQYLEAVDGRAGGKYLEWHENGKLKIQGAVIEGLADLTPAAQQSWLFEGPCNIFDERGNISAEFFYDKGRLEKEARYYFPNGKLQKLIPYTQGLVHGTLYIYDEEGNPIEEVEYKDGLKNGRAKGLWSSAVSKYQEQNHEGQIIYGSYFDSLGSLAAQIENGSGTKALFHENKLHTLISYNNGVIDGEIKVFSSKGKLQSTYCIRNEKKNGEEWRYYETRSEELKHKLMVTWQDDKIQGMVKTWYESGILESEREMTNNKKHGLSFAYYQSGDLMLMEEYENDRLLKGSYYKKGEEAPVSTVEGGEGIATLFNEKGFFLRKVNYEKGKPVVD